MYRKAFTLIELLVVISIIALLIAILLPVLSSVRDSAMVSQCLSNQRQFGNALYAFATDRDQDLPIASHWYTFAGRAGSADGVAARPQVGRTGLASEVGTGNVLAARQLNDYLGDNPEVARCPDDQGDAYEALVDNAYEDYGISYFPQFKDGSNDDIFGVISIIGRGQPQANGTYNVQAESERLGEAVSRSGKLYTYSWSQKLIMGDFNWHANRALTNPKNRWHMRNSDTQRASVMLFGDGHAEFLLFPDTYGPRAVNLQANGFW